jgi:serine/threonine protein kinase
MRVILEPGDMFAGYTIEQLLGGGGMGNVYRARDPDLPRSVALKLLHRDLTADDYVRARFELEAAHAAGLEHPNIVTVYRRGREDDQLWIAMQFIDATDGAATLDDGPLDPAHVVHIISETAKALDHAHGEGVLHRDVKPANILLERSRPGRPGRVLLADFGIAKALAETGRMTQTGMLVASLQYASPEQFDNVDLDARADEYSLGCTLFHLLIGELPYPGSTLPQLWAGHVHAPIPKPCLVRTGLPSAFDAVIERAIAKDRAHRYQSCGELAAAARGALYAPPPRPQPPVHDPQWAAPTVPGRIPPQPIRRSAERHVVIPDAPPRPFPDLPHAPTQAGQPLQPFAPPPATGGDADSRFRWMASAGLILLIALIGSALLTWKAIRSYYSSYLDAYSDYDTYEFLGRLARFGAVEISVDVALGVLVAVGVVLILLALRRRTRQPSAGRLARVGTALLVFVLFIWQLAIYGPTSLADKKDEMTMVALVGAALLLAGCWRGLSPSKRNVAWLVCSGIGVIVLAIVGQWRQNLWVLGEGYGGYIAGIALTAAGLVLAVRRGRLANESSDGHR